jgi:hypothetical protein
MRGWETPTLLGPLERANLDHLLTQQGRCLPSHLRMETDPVSKTLCSIVFRILDDGQISKTQ